MTREEWLKNAWDLRQKLIAQSIIETNNFDNDEINKKVRDSLGEIPAVIEEKKSNNNAKVVNAVINCLKLKNAVFMTFFYLFF